MGMWHTERPVDSRGYVFASHDIDLSPQVQSKRQHLWQTRGFFAYIHAVN